MSVHRWDVPGTPAGVVRGGFSWGAGGRLRGGWWVVGGRPEDRDRLVSIKLEEPARGAQGRLMEQAQV